MCLLECPSRVERAKWPVGCSVHRYGTCPSGSTAAVSPSSGLWTLAQFLGHVKYMKGHHFKTVIEPTSVPMARDLVAENLSAQHSLLLTFHNVQLFDFLMHSDTHPQGNVNITGE